MKFYFSQSTYGRKKEKHPEDSLLDALQKTRYDLEIAYEGFNYALDPELIDCYIYEVTALYKRYSYLLHQLTASRLEVSAELSLQEQALLSDAEAAAASRIRQVLV